MTQTSPDPLPLRCTGTFPRVREKGRAIQKPGSEREGSQLVKRSKCDFDERRWFRLVRIRIVNGIGPKPVTGTSMHIHELVVTSYSQPQSPKQSPIRVVLHRYKLPHTTVRLSLFQSIDSAGRSLLRRR